MRRGNVSLQNPDRSHRVWISVREADEMVAKGNAVRVSARQHRTAVRMVPQVKPSTSEDSLACFTLSDMHAVVGLHGEPAQYEARIKLSYFRPTVQVSY